MFFKNTARKIIFLTFLIIISVPAFVFSQNISLTVGDAIGNIGEKFVPLEIRVTSLTDTIAGFQIKLQFDRPDLVKFQLGEVLLNDTTYWQCNQFTGSVCDDSSEVLSFNSWDFYHVDSTMSQQYIFDTASHIMPNWKTYTNSLSGTGYDILLSSLGAPQDSNFIFPSPDEKLLIRLYLEVTDSLNFPSLDTVAQIFLENEFIDNFSFSTPSGEAIGRHNEFIIDTVCYECLLWADTVCLFWNRISSSFGDSIDTSLCDFIAYYPDTISVFDSTYWQLTNGSFTLTSCGYASGIYDIADLVALVNYMFKDGSLKSNAEADYNCDCQIDIADLVGFIAYMFQGGAEPGCGTQ